MDTPLVEDVYQAIGTIEDGSILQRHSTLDYQVYKCFGPTEPSFAVAICVTSVASGAMLRVCHFGPSSVKSGAAYAVGDRLTSDGSGRAVKSTSLADRIIGYALDAATAADQYKVAFIAPTGGFSGGLIPPHKLTDATTQTGAKTLAAADSGQRLPCTGTWTLTVPSAATLGNGFGCEVANIGSGTITVDWPNAANSTIAANEVVYMVATGGVLLFAKSSFSVG